MTKPKEEGGGGYDEETARQVCGKMQAELGESFTWAGSIKEMPSVDNLIRGKALHPLRTVHPEEWPEVREYLEEELEKSAHTLAGKPLLLDHYQVLQGKVLGAEYEDGAIEYVAQLKDPGVMELVRNGAIKHCSVEFQWESLEQVNGVAPRGINFTGLSLLRLFQPGDPLTTVEVWEGIVKQLKEAKNARRTENQEISTAKEQGNQEPEKDEHGCIIGKERYDEEQDKCVPIETATEQQGDQEPERDEHGCIIGKERYDETQGKCVPIETATEQQGEEKPPEAGEPKTDRQRFMDHFGIDEEAFQKFYDLLGDELFKLLPEPGTKRQQQAAEKKKGLGEAIIPPTSQELAGPVVSVKRLEAVLPSLQAERSMSWGAQRFVQDVKKLIYEARKGGNA